MLAVYLAGVSISARNKNYHLRMLLVCQESYVHPHCEYEQNALGNHTKKRVQRDSDSTTK